MDSFGKRLADCRKTKNLSRKDLADIFNTSYTPIGKYERNEINPSIEAAKKLAKILDTTVGYLLGETKDADLFNDPKMLQRFQDIVALPENQRKSLLFNIDHFIRSAKISMILKSLPKDGVTISYSFFLLTIIVVKIENSRAIGKINQNIVNKVSLDLLSPSK